MNALYCDDCLKILPTIPDRSVDLILCDLPYGTTQNEWDCVIPFDALWTQYNRICKGPIVLTAMQPFAAQLIMSNPKQFKYEWIWSKQQGTGFLNAKKQPMRSHESILVFYDNQPTFNPQMREGFKPYRCKSGRGSSNYRPGISGAITVSNGERYPMSVLEFAYDRPQYHPTQKPIALLEYIIRTYTLHYDLVLDNCMGSGSTGVAALNIGRRFIGIESDSEYFKIAQRRIGQSQSLNSLFEFVA